MINRNVTNKSTLLLDHIVKESIYNEYEEEASPPNFENVTTRKKRNPPNDNLCSSFYADSLADDCDTSFPGDPTVDNERRGDNLAEQLNEIRRLKHTEFEERKATNSVSDNLTGNTKDEFKLGAWEKYNTGFASKIMKRMGYGGKGLGKREDGIIDPIMPSINRGLTTSLLGGCVNLNSKVRDVKNNVKPWPKGTTLITGDSILCGIEENRLKKAKVRVFIGACVDDMYDFLTPLLKKKPTNIILHIGSNDSPFKTSEEIVSEIVNLKKNILSILPTVRIYLSCPTVRFDNFGANAVLRKVEEKLKSLFNDVILNDNVDRSCVGKKGLHLNPKGSGRLAINFISLMRRL